MMHRFGYQQNDRVMKNAHYNIRISFLLGLLFFAFGASAQSNYTLAAKPNLKVSGTSTLHDWDMVSEQASGEAQFVVEGNALKEIKKLRMEMPAETIKSGKGGMDKNAYGALETKKHKTVIFELENLVKGEGNSWTAEGTFTIAGVKKPATFPVTARNEGNGYRFEGSHIFKLTDFNVDPPTALFGTIKTGDEMSIHFNVVFNPIK